jgi:CO/xanthine dehydrogenase Mo-binding subunit
MRRHENLRLITGRGRYTDDVILQRMTHAFVLRSPVAHAPIKRIDAAAAQRMPGVLFVGSSENLRADRLGDLRPTESGTFVPLRSLTSRSTSGQRGRDSFSNACAVA